MEIVYDFLEGRATYEDFIEQLYSDDTIFNWFQSMVTEVMLKDSSFWCRNSLDRHNGDFKLCIDGRLGWGIITMVDIYDFIYHFLSRALPDREIFRVDYYKKLADVHMNAVGECYGGPEVEGMITDLIMGLPEDLPKTKKVKLAKEKLRELFPGKKRPFWIEGPEWPVCNGKPMIYISRKIDGDLFQYKFEDPDTGEQRIVEQFA